MACKEASPSIARYLAIHSLLGGVIGVLGLAALLATDTAGIRTLIAASHDRLMILAILLAGSVITVMPMVLATAIGLLARRDAAEHAEHWRWNFRRAARAALHARTHRR